MSTEFSVRLPATSDEGKYVFIDAFHGVAIPSRLKISTSAAPFNNSFGGRGSLLRFCSWYLGSGAARTAKQRETVIKHLERIFADVLARLNETVMGLLQASPSIGRDVGVYMAHDDLFRNESVEEYEEPTAELTAEAVAKAKAKSQPTKVTKPVDKLTVVAPGADIEPQTTEYDRCKWPEMIADHVGDRFQGVVIDHDENSKGESRSIYVWQVAQKDGPRIPVNHKAASVMGGEPLRALPVKGNTIGCTFKVTKPPAAPKKAAAAPAAAPAAAAMEVTPTPKAKGKAKRTPAAAPVAKKTVGVKRQRPTKKSKAVHPVQEWTTDDSDVDMDAESE